MFPSLPNAALLALIAPLSELARRAIPDADLAEDAVRNALTALMSGADYGEPYFAFYEVLFKRSGEYGAAARAAVAMTALYVSACVELEGDSLTELEFRAHLAHAGGVPAHQALGAPRPEWRLAGDLGELLEARRELEEAREAVGSAWTKGMSLADAIRAKTRALEGLADDGEGAPCSP